MAYTIEDIQKMKSCELVELYNTLTTNTSQILDELIARTTDTEDDSPGVFGFPGSNGEV
jgi:uncharacterized protein YvpB